MQKDKTLTQSYGVDMNYNQTILTPDQEQALIFAVLSHIDGWRPGYHEATAESSLGRLLSSLKLKFTVYISITPHVRFYRDGVSHEYSSLEVDVRGHPSGNPRCDHLFIELYWEEGGGGLDSGTPNRYVMCSECGKAHNVQRGVGWVASLFRLIQR
jgi:hypothetical protein